jgi:hypothetical protein
MGGAGVRMWWRSRSLPRPRAVRVVLAALAVTACACGPAPSARPGAETADDPTAVAASSPGVAAPTAEGPVSVAPREGAATGAARRDVLLVGDSLLHALVPALTDGLDAFGIDVHVAGAPGTGLLSDQMDWVGQIARAVEAHDPEIVLIESCCNYGATPEHPEYDYWLIDGSTVEPDSSTMYELWAQAADQAVAAAAAYGAQVLWVITPPVQDDHALHDRIERLNRIARHLVEAHPDLEYVDWDLQLTGPDGGIIDPVPLGDGRFEPLRVDFIHFGDAANALLVAETVDAIVGALDRPDRSVR